MSLSKKVMLAYLADTIASLIFWNAVNSFIELVIVQLTWEQWAVARITGSLCYLPIARLYGLYRDWLVATIDQGNRIWLRIAIADALAFTSFEISYYAAVLVYAGATARQVGLACLSLALFTVVAGRPYGRWLEWIRKKIIR